MLAVKDLSVTYQNNKVLNGFNLNLEQGDIFALLGDSGSGKSSALRFIAGLDNADNGRVELDGRQLSVSGKHQITPELREVGMVFQDYALFPHMNVEKNITFGISNQPKSEQQARVKELLSLIGLEGIEKKYPHQLSGGEQQRVALARALAPSPKLLLLDEPFSSLDKNHRNQLVSQVRSILKKAQVTSILVTHDEDEANALADKVGTIQNKKLTIK
ncbi:MAG: ABC transporter ATP-binding protein [Candidatus Thioglobus sp.]|jgi:iron(III) transport system ATP-binding protein|nr:MAG: ABC transporter ATP-binding protein [Candidatus Thioglobus sp.]RUM81089.1 MAG: ABC transporter ATP-binding protein [Candidatus Thioglobus sp.]RUM84047.1 MAG: ABC transporter ATP-binding protein [Candidatus Thioglobus sp.]RUM85054.1 MAG: ABC transporter ATP-binding protein [Candidatus Thioglobus sp.]HIB30984.1 ABC transporter ATP-binding protein [Candidatus Thioglobus sp.]